MPTTWDGTPKTWSTGELVTAALLNTELRDRMEYLEALLAVNGYIKLEDQQTSGTNGGTFTSGSWQTRVLNTKVSDTGGYCSLSSNQATLAAGTYLVRGTAPAGPVGHHQLRLQNVTDGTTLLTGSNTQSTASANSGNVAHISGIITVVAGKALEVQHQCQTTSATVGLGSTCGFGTEVFAALEFIRIGD
jgi:hypothetical protein